MHEIAFPSRLPGWALIIAVVMTGLLGAHISLAAFAHHVMGHHGSWIWHVAGGEGWQAFGVLARCAPSELFGGLSVVGRRSLTPYQRWCRQWWSTFDTWTRGPGGSFFGGTMLFMPLQNRVLPTQEIVADPGRGLLMGNRGMLHNRERDLVRRHDRLQR